MKFKPLACSFHSHCDASLDGASTVEAKIKRAAEIGRVADCLTDHGIMSGLVPHYMATQKLAKDKKNPINIKSIHGIEAYIIDEHRPWKEFKNGKREPAYSHLTIHFKTLEAYKYFCQLTEKMEERAISKYGEKKPLMYLHELEPISGQITIGSGCLLSPIQKNVLRGRHKWAAEMYERIRAIAGPGNFFVEVFPHVVNQDWQKPVKDKFTKQIITPGQFVPKSYIQKDNIHGLPVERGIHVCSMFCTEHSHYNQEHEDLCNGGIDIQREPNMWVIQMAKKYDDPIIMSLDDHYAKLEDRLVQDVRLSNGSTESWRFSNYYHMMTSDECAEIFRQQLKVEDRDLEEWIDNSYRFVELFDKYKVETSKDRWLLPTTEMVYEIKGKDSRELVWELIEKHGRMPSKDDPQYQIYKDRVEYEISVLKDNGEADFLPYFFVMEDCVSFARSKDIIWNTRGSAGGSLIFYLLGVSITDPIKYNLPFERFLTLGRIKSGSLPDSDTDWEERELILEYLKEKYGERFALISNDLLLKLKSSIKDVERYMRGYVSFETEEMCKAIKGAPQGITDKEWLYGYKDAATGAEVAGFWDSTEAEALKKYSIDNPDIWKSVEMCIGISKTKGIHAGGIVLSPRPITQDFPVLMSPKGKAIAYNMKGVEACGGVKYDFLGVSTLKAISYTLKSIKKRLGINIKWEEFPYDPSVFEDILAKDLLEAIFQLNTNLVRPCVKKVKPKSIKDLAAITATYRPGALDAPSPNPKDDPKKTAASYFVECAQGLSEPYYIHEDLRSILSESYGVLIYQEQTLQIYRDLAGYTFETAEEVRRGIGKKDKDVLAKHGAILLEKLIERGWGQEQADKLFQSIQASARYSFNKAHAVSYAIIAYNGCWLKKHYPLDFWLGELTAHGDDTKKMLSYLQECRKYLLNVDIIHSHVDEWVVEGDKLRPPLSLIKGCGAKGIRSIKNFIESDGAELEIEEVTEDEKTEGVINEVE